MKKCIFVISVLASMCGFCELTPGDMSLAMFKSGLIKDPTVFKVKVAVADHNEWTWWSGHPLYGSRDQYWTLRVRPFADRGEAGNARIICFAKKDSDAGKTVAQYLKDGSFHSVNIQIRYLENSQYDECCVVDALEPLVGEVSSEVVAKFGATRISVTKNEFKDYLQGKIAVSFRTKLKYFKKPILRVVLLTEENGSRVVRDCIIDEPNVKMVSESDSMDRNTTTAGNDLNEPPFWHRYVEEISQTQSEVAAAKCEV